jgi:fimbrial isopeptide formation D2 family protein
MKNNRLVGTIFLLFLAVSLASISATLPNASATSVTFTKSHSPNGNVNVGATVSYTITLSVQSETNVLSITDTLPAGLTYVSGSETHNPAASFGIVGQVLTWNFGAGPFASGSTQTVTFSATAATAGSFNNQVVASYTETGAGVASEPSVSDPITIIALPTPSPTIVPTPTPTDQPPSVGGEFAPVSILQLLAPYIAVAFIGAVAIASLVMYRKRKE